MISYSTTTSSIKEKEERKLTDKYSMYLNKQLGKGGFGQLYLGRNLKENDLRFALTFIFRISNIKRDI